MGFEDDFDYNDDFETDIADPDNMDGGEQPKKLSRKELKEAKKKNAEKTADLPRHKKGLFGKRERLDDNDESLTDDHIFDPTRSTMISTPRDRSREKENAPIRSKDSEFSYLFDPVDEDESEDDVYPEQSIYSDANAARDLLAGLSYDGSKNSDSEDFDKYFDDHAKPPESKFSFKKKKQKDVPPPEPESIPEPPAPAKPASVKVIPKKTEPKDEEVDSFLPDLRPGSVFATQPAPEPVPEQKKDANLPPLPPLPKRNDPPRYPDSRHDFYDDFEDDFKYDQDEDDYYMNHDQDKNNQDYMPYGGMYPSYPMSPVNQMMPYPVVIPNSGQNQSGNMPIQTIPIPYPMPMPMPMPMYGQYPQYQQYPPQYPPYPPQDPYGRYRDDRYDPYEDRRDSGRRGSRFNDHRHDNDRRNYDDRRDDRRDLRHDTRYDNRYDSRYDNRYDGYDDRYDSRYDDRYDDRRDRRSFERRDRRMDERGGYDYPARDDSRRTVPPPPYESPYPGQQNSPAEQPRPTIHPEPIAPIYTPAPEPVQTAASAPEAPKYTPSPFANTDFSFRKPAETPTDDASSSMKGLENALGSNSLGNDGFDDQSLGNDGFDDQSFGGDGFDDQSFGGDGFDDPSFGGDGFDDQSFGGDGFDDPSFGGDGFDDQSLESVGFGDISFDAVGNSDSSEEDDFGLGFGNKSITSDHRPSFDNDSGKSSGGRFKKRK